MNVTITSPFWKRRRDQIVESVIPYQWGVMNDEIDTTVPDDPAGNQLADNKSHAVANLKVAAGELDDEFHGMVFQDSDVYKWLEEAAYALAYHPDPELKALCDRTVDLIARAQQSDGYLDTPYQIKSGVWADRPRFSLIQQSHEMYVMGHYIEAAVAYHQVTGNEQALEVAKKMADCLDANFGPEEGKIHGADGHPEIELALAKLYEETGEKRYLTLSQYLIDVRGQDPQFYAKQLKAMNGDNIFHDLGFYKPTYFQAAEPVRDQQTADGHAVRVGYLCTGVAHVGRLLGDRGLIDTAKRFWKNIVTRRMYVTGAIGSTHVGESFTYDYDLPNDTMYGETCASVAMSMFAQQMLDLEPKGEYADVLEKELFNGSIAGISLDGKQYYYVNALETTPDGLDNPDRHHVLSHRVDWFGCACCPANIARLIASLWDVKDGSIELGGVDIRTLPLAECTKRIAYVSQDNYLFDLSVMDNIRMGRKGATDAEVIDAAKKCGCHEFIMGLENGYQTVCGASGGHLSGGERQRISIARAMLKDAPIVILDEATSYTDPENEAVIQSALGRLVRGKTLLVIAHRLSTIADADQIIVVNQGKIEATGTQAELLASCPLYQTMWEAHISVKDDGEVA